VDQELLTLPEHLSSTPVFSGVLVTRSLVLYVCFVDRCLSFCTFSFGHCVVCSSSKYGFGIFKLFYTIVLVYDFAIGFWNCLDCVVFVVSYDFGTVQTVWYLLFPMILELFRLCGILELFRLCGILELFRLCGILELFRLCGICCFL
jgi:hypothetical protein